MIKHWWASSVLSCLSSRQPKANWRNVIKSNKPISLRFLFKCNHTDPFRLRLSSKLTQKSHIHPPKHTHTCSSFLLLGTLLSTFPSHTHTKLNHRIQTSDRRRRPLLCRYIERHKKSMFGLPSSAVGVMRPKHLSFSVLAAINKRLKIPRNGKKGCKMEHPLSFAMPFFAVAKCGVFAQQIQT